MSRNELQNISIVCHGTAGLFRSLTWKKDGIDLVSDGASIRIVSSGESLLEAKVSTLNLIHVKEETSGIYQCEATPARKEDKNVYVSAKVKVYCKFHFRFLPVHGALVFFFKCTKAFANYESLRCHVRRLPLLFVSRPSLTVPCSSSELLIL